MCVRAILATASPSCSLPPAPLPPPQKKRCRLLKRVCCAIAADRLGSDRVDPNGEPAMPSEDFAFYAQRIPGFYAFLGNGDTQANHHPEYTFNLANLVPGAAYWVSIAEGMLK